jgi:hypothetical protein
LEIESNNHRVVEQYVLPLPLFCIFHFLLCSGFTIVLV